MDSEHWSVLETVLGTELLSQICGPFDDGLAEARLDYLLDLVARLKRRYDAAGVREWLVTPSDAVGGVRPVEVLAGAWTPDDAAAQRLRDALPPARP